MDKLNATAVVENGRLKLDVPTSLPPGEVKVEIVVTQGDEKPRGTDIQALLALAGTLKWKGDPLEFQRKLRDEWPD